MGSVIMTPFCQWIFHFGPSYLESNEKQENSEQEVLLKWHLLCQRIFSFAYFIFKVTRNKRTVNGKHLNVPFSASKSAVLAHLTLKATRNKRIVNGKRDNDTFSASESSVLAHLILKATGNKRTANGKRLIVAFSAKSQGFMTRKEGKRKLNISKAEEQKRKKKKQKRNWILEPLRRNSGSIQRVGQT